MPTAARPLEFVKVGDILVDKYRVESVIGTGGMGVVVACTHLTLGERVAIKLLRPESMEGPALERFTREAKATAKLKSSHVARVMDVGVLDTGIPYMVMEHLDGSDLGDVLAHRGHLPVEQVIDLMLPVASALAEAHANGIVHRDIKPTNLFMTRSTDEPASIKLLDFGISKALEGADVELTQTQSMLGTPAYMSPEQMRSARLVDERTDIWSLGSVIYELIEGVRPFQGKTFSELCVVVATDPPTPMVHAPPGLQDVLWRCLAKAPEQRFSSMWELGKALEPFAGDRQAAATLVERMHRQLRRSHGELAAGSNISPDPSVARSSDVSSRADTVLQSTRPFAPPAGSRARLVWTIAGLVCIAAGVAGLIIVRSSQAPASGIVTVGSAEPPAIPIEAPSTGPPTTRPESSGRAMPERARATVPGTATLSVRANIEATFMIDGKLAGRGKQLDVPTLTAGEHQLEVRAHKYVTVRRPISLAAGEGLALEVQLVRATPSPKAKPTVAPTPPTPAAPPAANDKNRILPM
ncbi:MAG: serine/threonine protein kinase [Kofleriaceae bacterium]